MFKLNHLIGKIKNILFGNLFSQSDDEQKNTPVIQSCHKIYAV